MSKVILCFARTINSVSNNFDSVDKNKQKWCAECEQKQNEYNNALYIYNKMSNKINCLLGFKKKKAYNYR